MSKMMFATIAWAALCVSPVLALECPTPAAVEDAKSAQAIEKILPPGVDLQAPDALQSAVFDLRQAGVQPGAMIDALITAQCTKIASETGLPEPDKMQRLEVFSREVSGLVEGSSN